MFPIVPPSSNHLRFHYVEVWLFLGEPCLPVYLYKHEVVGPRNKIVFFKKELDIESEDSSLIGIQLI